MQRLADFRLEHDAFSGVATEAALCLPLHRQGDRFYVWPVYVAGALPDVPSREFLGRRFTRVTGLSAQQFAAIMATVPEMRRAPLLGRVCEIDFDQIIAWRSTRDPELLARESASIDALLEVLQVERSAVGLTGSIHYRPRDEITDIDFVVYGEEACRVANQRLQPHLPQHEDQMLHKLGRSHFTNFRIPGLDAWFDARLVIPESLTATLIERRYVPLGYEALEGAEITDDEYGAFYPARYTLADGTVLLSYRFGHSGYFVRGQKVFGPALPLIRMGDTTYRLSIDQESFRALPPRPGRMTFAATEYRR